MGYFIDLKTISIFEYGIKLKDAYLVPSRMILKNNIPGNFEIINNQGIKTVFDLQQALKTKVKLQNFSQKSGLDINYLTILLREINSINPKPNKLAEFPGLPKNILNLLERDNIKNTFQLYNYVKTIKNRKEFAKKYKIDKNLVLELTKLTDLSRIKWASPLFCRILIILGYDTVEKVTKANAEKMHQEINEVNEKNEYYKGKIGLNDTKIFLEAAKEVKLEVEY